MISVFDDSLNSIDLIMDVPTAATLEMALIEIVGRVKSESAREKLETVLECLDSAMTHVPTETEILMDLEIEP